MSSLTLVFVALGLAMDALAVAVAVSTMLPRVSVRQIFRLGFHFGLFQALMPVLGWLAGRSLSNLIAQWDHWVAFGLLAFVGGKAVRAGLRGPSEPQTGADPTRGVSLLVLCVATSLDALAVGLSFAMLKVRIWYPSVLIGCVTAVLTVTGMLLGSRLGAHFGRRTEVVGGLILIVIGVKILAEHLL